MSERPTDTDDYERSLGYGREPEPEGDIEQFKRRRDNGLVYDMRRFPMQRRSADEEYRTTTFGELSRGDTSE